MCFVHRVALESLRLVLVVAVVVVFVGAAGTSASTTSSKLAPDSGAFGDDDDSVHEYNIELIVEWGIGRGCAPGRFCPSTAITRSEMAAWLSQASTRLYGASPPVRGSVQISGEPMSSGTPVGEAKRAHSGNLDPGATVTRADAAEMLVAVFGHLAVGSAPLGLFSDALGAPEAAVLAMEGIYGAGVTKGCAVEPLRYCPNQKITRAQAASLLSRAVLGANPTVGLILNKPHTAQGYTLLTADAADSADYAYLIDHLGRIVHTWRLDRLRRVNWYPKLLRNGNLLIMDRTIVTEITSAGDIVWSCYAADFHHDFLKLPNGNVLLLVRGFKTRDEAIAAGFHPDFIKPDGLEYDFLLEIKPTGPDTCEVVWEWSVWDHMIQDHDPSKDNYGIIADHPERIDINYPFDQLDHNRRHDWLHSNAIDYNPSLDQIMLSVRHYSELWIIDHNTTTEEASGPKGDLLYRWGNPQTYQAGDFEDQRLFWQHNTHWIPPGLPGEGNILIFNNGAGDTGFVRWYSSVDEITPPPFDGDAYQKEPNSAFGPDEATWTYTAEERTELFYAPRGASAQRLPNGNTLILDGPQGTIFQVTPTGKTVWEYINPIKNYTSELTYQGDLPYKGNPRDFPRDNSLFRVEWYPPDHPGLQGIDLTPKGPIELYR